MINYVGYREAWLVKFFFQKILAAILSEYIMFFNDARLWEMF